MNEKKNSEGYMDLTPYQAIRNIEKEKQVFPFHPLVYICSPYSGDIEQNVKNAKFYSRFAALSGSLPITPHLLFTQYLDDDNLDERKLGLFFGIVLLSKCRELWVFGDVISSGMQEEIEFAMRKNIPIRRFTKDCIERNY